MDSIIARAEEKRTSLPLCEQRRLSKFFAQGQSAGHCSRSFPTMELLEQVRLSPEDFWVALEAVQDLATWGRFCVL
ncbi:hypothetical protein KDW_04470 [Dictyobacter vulcani]|uniref:Uncharacterized protein n=1 Tax=Dictyobacter vulcani TaxID=2607529 RepID=A0A5J4KFW5_9CHLR|nr:hypothetical protein KDW_04470 [Dictyobacter vulcani]